MSLVRYMSDRIATQQILEDLEAQEEKVHNNNDNEFEVEYDYDDGVIQIDNSNGDANGGGERCQFWKRHHFKLFFIVLALSAIIAAVILFGPNASNDRTAASAGNELDESTYFPTYAPTVGGVVESVTEYAVNETDTPTYAPTIDSVVSTSPTASPVSAPPTASPVAFNNWTVKENNIDGEVNGTSLVVEGGSIGNFTNGTYLFEVNSTIMDDLLLVQGNITSNETTLMDNEAALIEEEGDNEALEINEDTTSLSFELTEIDSTAAVSTNATDDGSLLESTTSSSGGDDNLTTDVIDVVDTTTTTSTIDATTNTATVVTTTSTADAITTTSTTSEATTTSSTPETTITATSAALAVNATTTVKPTHLCTDTATGKIFKIAITPTSSTTSLELLQLHDKKNGEYTLFTTYPTDDDELQQLELGTRYVKKLCILPGDYKFVIKESQGACYMGFLKGSVIFEECGDGEYEFEF